MAIQEETMSNEDRGLVPVSCPRFNPGPPEYEEGMLPTSQQRQ
jgi:hypothetical protein